MLINNNPERDKIYSKMNDEFTWKDFFYYELEDLIKLDPIFSKLPYLMGGRKKIHSLDNYINLIKNISIIPILFFWNFVLKIEYLYYRNKYPNFHIIEDLKNKDFDYLFVLNTTDHTITALPVLESMDNKTKCLVVTFRSVYVRYKNDFDKLKNTKIIFFDYELKNLSPTKYLKILGESNEKYEALKSQNMVSDIKQLIEFDKNFIKYHLKTELVQYYFFENVFNAFDFKGAISIVFTTAFELCKERKISTFVLQHGIGGKGHGHPYVSDYWFTLDDASKEQLDEWLDNTVEVLPLGSPRFEYLKNHMESELHKKNTKFHKKTDKLNYKKTVTFISQGYVYDTQTTFYALKKLRNKLPQDINLIIKLHPRFELNTENEMKKIFTRNELQNTMFIMNEIDFYEIILNSDIVITSTSTGMLETIACDIPLIQVNYTGKKYSKVYDLSSFGWKDPITNPDEMVNIVSSILEDKIKYIEVQEKQKLLKHRMLKNFGECGRIISGKIVRICERNN